MPWVGSRYEFHKVLVPKKDVLSRLRDEAKAQPERRMVHLCFTCDPYPIESLDGVLGLPRDVTRHAINLLKDAGHGVQILTKGGDGSTADLDLLDERDEYATTLTLSNDAESRLWEPFAALPSERVDALHDAVSYGVVGWASLEPVIFPSQSLHMLKQALEVGISKAKIGPLNYKGRLPKWLQASLPEHVDWQAFAATAREMCRDYGAECILKNDLKALIGEADV
jgi:DNA repair photolyase